MSKFTRNTILYSIIFFLSSCSTWHYTNYGKPFDFLKAERVAFNNGHISKKNKKELTADFNVNEQVNRKKSTIKSEISSPNNQLVCQEHSPSSKKEPQFISVNKINPKKTFTHQSKSIKKDKIKSFITEKIEKKISKVSNMASIKENYPKAFENDDITDLALLLVCLLFPPVAVWWLFEFEREFWIDILLFIPMFISGSFKFLNPVIGFILPVAYAIYVCFLR